MRGKKSIALKTLRALSAEGEKVYTTELKWKRMKERLLQALKEFQPATRWFPAWTWKSCAANLPTELSPKIFRVVVDMLIQGETHRQGRKPAASDQPSSSSSAARKKS